MYRIRAGRRIGSAALIAEGQHARADGLTSLAVILGVIGVWLGFPQADALMGFLIAGAILWILWGSLKTSVVRLMDGVDPVITEQLEQIANTVPGVEAVNQVRARWSGHRLESDIQIAVAHKVTVLRAHGPVSRLSGIHECLQLLHGIQLAHRPVGGAGKPRRSPRPRHIDSHEGAMAGCLDVVLLAHQIGRCS